MLALVDIPEFLRCFSIQTPKEFYDLEFTMGPSTLEDMLGTFSYEPLPSPLIVEPIKTIGRYEVSLDHLTQKVVIHQHDQEDDESYENTLF